MDNLKNWGIHYISNRKVRPMDAVMFDIDDTLIFTDGRPNIPIIELLYRAKQLGYKIVIITARPGIQYAIQWTIKQLGDYKIGCDYLGFTSAETKLLIPDTASSIAYHLLWNKPSLSASFNDFIKKFNLSKY